MTLKSQLQTIHHQIQQNKQAFKKNKQNINTLNTHPQKEIKSNTDLKQIKNILKQNLKSLSTHKTTSTQAYQCVIKQLKLLLKQAWTKNQFLYKDRAEVLTENNKLKQFVQELKLELEESKRVLCEMRLNGYAGGEVNGVYQNGKIFNTIQIQQLSSSSQEIVSQQDCYNMESKKYQHVGYMKDSYDRNFNGNGNFNSKEKSQPVSQEESMLLRQGSQEGLDVVVSGNHRNTGYNKNNNNINNNKLLNLNTKTILSPSDHQYQESSSSPSQINQTPNYNFRQANFQIQQFNNNIQNRHFVDIGSEFISYANSCNNSGKQSLEGSNQSYRDRNNGVEKGNQNNNRNVGQMKSKNHNNKNNNNNKNTFKQIQISLNNTDSKQLYLTINNNTNNHKNNNLKNNNTSQQQQQQQLLIMNSNQQQQKHKTTNIDLHLPIDENKVILKQQIQTFKQHLRICGDESGNSNGSQNQQVNCTPNQSPNINIKNNINHNNSQSNNNTTTPYGSKTQQCIVTCLSTSQQGIFRSFYLSLLRFPIYRQKIFFIFQQLETDQSFTLYKPYPRNDFWVGLLGSFLKMIDVCKQSPQYILQHLNRFKLIDTLMIQALKSRVEYLYNDFENNGNGEELDQSSLLNGSLSNNNNNSNNYNNNKLPISSTNLQSMNVSLQNITQFQQQPQQNTTRQPQSSTQNYLQIFNALATSFDINCQSNSRCFQFYHPQQQLNEINPSPIFVIQNNQQLNSFVFGFGLYYERSQQNSISREFVNNNNNLSNSNNEHNMMYEYENSVKRQFEDINIDLPLEQCSQGSQNSEIINERNNNMNKNWNNNNLLNQSSNLLNSGEHFFAQRSNNKNNNNNNNKSNRYNNLNSNNNLNTSSRKKTLTKNFHNQLQQSNGSFISQTNQYQQNQNDYDEYQSSQYISQYQYNHHQIVSENISYRFNNNQTNQQQTMMMMMRSLRNSQQYDGSDGTQLGGYQHKEQYRQQINKQRRELRQRTSINFYNNYMHQPIEQQLLETQSKQLLLSKHTSKSPYNNNMLSKFSSIHIQPSSSKQSSQVFSRMKLVNNNINDKNGIKNKQNLRYGGRQKLHSPSLYDEDYIRRKVNSVESDYQDSPMQESLNYYDDEIEQ